MPTIFTKHALQRLQQRSITEQEALKTFNNPTLQKRQRNNSYKFIREFDDRVITIVGKKSARGEWIVLSAWSKSLTDFQKKKLQSQKPSLFRRMVRYIFG